MGDAAEMLTGVPSRVWVPGFGIVLTVVTVYTSYATFARALKWLTSALFAYVVAALLARPDWHAALVGSVVPALRWDTTFLGAFVAVVGTTISPYLFFWQASQEVEEERALGRTTLGRRRGATPHELRDARTDVVTGMCFSNVVMYFIILCTAATLHRAGAREIETSRQAAEALRPLAGDAAYLLFTLGVVGTGLLAVPILAGSASYAVAELFAWRAGLDFRPHQAKRFYLVLVLAIMAGMLFDAFEFNAVRLLFLSAVVNGLLAPPLLVLVMLVGSNPRIMGEHVNSRWLNVLGWTATVLMGAAAVALGVSVAS
jgi:Mn2+/Fe2+ NRAMP family transporter